MMHFSLGWKWAALILFSGLTTSFAAEPPPGKTGHASGRPPLLDAAFNAFVEHQGRWAFTETHSSVAMNGKPAGETIFRVDPSRPYTEQFIPVKLGGNPPSEKQLKEWAERGQMAAKQREQPRMDTDAKVHQDDEVDIRINNRRLTPELEHAIVLAEDETSVTYDVPLREKGSGEGTRFKKFELTVRVNKQGHGFERAVFRQRTSMRVQLIVKVSSGLIEMEFGSPDERFPAVPVKIISHATINILFGKAHVVHDVAVRSDLKHVTPYDERFGVKIGPMRTIEF